MRAPQYGHNKGKRRGSHKPPAAPKLWRAIGLHGPNQPLPTRRIRYHEPHVQVSLHLFHKSAKEMVNKKRNPDGQGPIISKQHTAVKNTHRHRG